MLRLLLVGLFLLSGWGVASSDCDRMYELWSNESGSHCLGNPRYSVLDIVAQMRGDCYCPGEKVAFSDLILRGNGYQSLFSSAMSPDGKHIYGSSSSEDSIIAFERDETSGEIVPIARYTNVIANADGLDGLLWVQISPDGQFVFTLGFKSQAAISVYRRDEETGKLQFLQTKRKGMNDLDILDRAGNFHLSADGAHLYTAGARGIGIFEIHPESGMLTLFKSIDSVPGISFSAASLIRVSPDGKHVYLQKRGSVNATTATFERDSLTGDLTFISEWTDPVANRIFADFHFTKNGLFVYVPNSSQSRILVFARDPSNGNLSPIQSLNDNSVGSSFAMDPSERFVYLTGTHIGSRVIIYSRDISNGTLTYLTHQDFPNIDTRKILVSPDGEDLYMASPALYGVSHFSRDVFNGTLTYESTLTDPEFDRFSNFRGVGGDHVISKDGRFIYSLGSGELTIFSRDPLTGAHEPLQTIETLDGLLEAEMLLSLDDRFLFVGGLRTIYWFSRDAETGRLNLEGSVNSGQGSPFFLLNRPSMAFDPSGQHLYIRDLFSLIYFQVNQNTGALRFGGSLSLSFFGNHSTSEVSSLNLSADGSFLYLADSKIDGIAVFFRNPLFGRLSFVDFSASDGIPGLEKTWSAKLSPDGEHFYVAGGDNQEAIAIFSRNASTGILTYIDTISEGLSTSEGGFDFADMAFSPDGNYLFFTGEEPGVTVFRRDVSSGLLSLFERFEFPQPRDFNEPIHLTMSADGRELLFSGVYENAIVRMKVFP